MEILGNYKYMSSNYISNNNINQTGQSVSANNSVQNPSQADQLSFKDKIDGFKNELKQIVFDNSLTKEQKMKKMGEISDKLAKAAEEAERNGLSLAEIMFAVQDFSIYYDLCIQSVQSSPLASNPFGM